MDIKAKDSSKEHKDYGKLCCLFRGHKWHTVSGVQGKITPTLEHQQESGSCVLYGTSYETIFIVIISFGFLTCYTTDM